MSRSPQRPDPRCDDAATTSAVLLARDPDSDGRRGGGPRTLRLGVESSARAVVVARSATRASFGIFFFAKPPRDDVGRRQSARVLTMGHEAATTMNARAGRLVPREEDLAVRAGRERLCLALVRSFDTWWELAGRSDGLRATRGTYLKNACESAVLRWWWWWSTAVTRQLHTEPQW